MRVVREIMPKGLPMVISALVNSKGEIINGTIKTHLIEPKFAKSGDAFVITGESTIQDGVLIQDPKQIERISTRLHSLMGQ